MSDVDLYKVGHHGSLNATPKTLWELSKKRGGVGQTKNLITVLSTLAGLHGDPSRKTEVPRATLLNELAKNSLLYSTATLRGTRETRACYHDVQLSDRLN